MKSQTKRELGLSQKNSTSYNIVEYIFLLYECLITFKLCSLLFNIIQHRSHSFNGNLVPDPGNEVDSPGGGGGGKGVKRVQLAKFNIVNPLSPNNDENEISPYMITAFSNIQVMRIKETITKECLDI